MVDICFYEDLDIILKSGLGKNFREGEKILITGATGLVGSQLVKAIVYMNAKVDVYVLVRSIEKAERVLGEFSSKVKYIVGDIVEQINVEDHLDYIIHCASVTQSKLMIEKPVETIDISINGTRNVLKLANKKKVRSLIYVSSMEMYGTFFNGNDEIDEQNIGYLNPLNVRSNYPESKRMCENMCIAYMSEYNVPVKIVRLAQTFGAGISKDENRVFAQFARSVINEKDIVLHTKGLSEGNYVYTRDMVCAILLVMFKGKNGEAYNVSNPESHTTIVEMANMVCEKIANNNIKVVFDIPEANVYGYAAETKLKLNANKLIELGWKPQVGLEEAYRRMICSMKDTDNY